MTEAPPVEPQLGAPAPSFTAPTTHGEPLTLSDLRGGPVLLFFYPFAFTGICTGELAALRDRYEEFTATGARVLGISTDSMYALRTFAEAERLPFDLLSDFWPHGEIARSYGVFVSDVGCALRGSFLIDGGGTLVWREVHPLGDARDLDTHLAALTDLRPATTDG